MLEDGRWLGLGVAVVAALVSSPRSLANALSVQTGSSVRTTLSLPPTYFNVFIEGGEHRVTYANEPDNRRRHVGAYATPEGAVRGIELEMMQWQNPGPWIAFVVREGVSPEGYRCLTRLDDWTPTDNPKVRATKSP